jgi:phosphoribosylformylglycinamidine synthase
LIYILGETDDELGASEYFKLLAKNDLAHLGSTVPKVNFQKNKKIYTALQNTIKKGLVASSLSVTSGGLACALAKASLGGMHGATVTLKKLPGAHTSIDAALFSESQGRILVTIAKKDRTSFEKLLKGISYAHIGTVSSGDTFKIADKSGTLVVDTTIRKLQESYASFSKAMS